MASNVCWETLSVDGSEMRVFTDSPQGEGPFPAVLVAHHRAGLDVATTKFVQDLAGLGYFAAAPDLHHRRPDGEDTRISLQNLDDIQIVSDLAATEDLVVAQNNVDGSRVAIAGHCMGGRVSFLGAAELPRIKANVAYYGGNMFKPWGATDTAPINQLHKLRGPVLAFFGEDDDNPSPSDMAALEEKLTKHGVAHEFHSYAGCGHAFQNFTNPAGYRAKATAESFARMAGWLAVNL